MSSMRSLLLSVAPEAAWRAAGESAHAGAGARRKAAAEAEGGTGGSWLKGGP